MKDRRERIKRLLKDDWALLLIASGLATTLWWNITQREIITKFLPGVEVNLATNLKPGLDFAPTQRTKPRVSVYVDGPKSLLESLTSEDFQVNADLRDIQDATKYEVFLNPADFVPKSHLVRGLPLNEIRVNKARGITPRKIEIETVWRKAVASIVPKMGGQPARGYIISSSSVSPATLTIAGSLEDLEKHKVIRNRNEIRLNGETMMPDQYWDLEALDLGDLEVLDWKPDKLIRFSIQIEPQFMEATFLKVPVIVPNVTEGAKLEINFDPAWLDVHLSGSRAVVQGVTNSSFAMAIDPSRIPSGTSTVQSRFLTPIGLPAGCQILQVTPALLNVQLWKPSDYVYPSMETWMDSRPASAGALVAPISSRMRRQSETPTPLEQPAPAILDATLAAPVATLVPEESVVPTPIEIGESPLSATAQIELGTAEGEP